MARPWIWLLLLAACDGGATSPGPPDSDFLSGVDVSALERVEQAGAVFRSGGNPGDALAILHAQGAGIARLRLFVSPNDSDVQVNDLPYTLRMAGRVKAQGMQLLLDMHYSDTWADPGHQSTPAAWAALNMDALEAQVESYSRDVILQLKRGGTLPDIVQVGNEIDAGFLWPLGRVGGAYDTPAQWDQFTRLLKAAIRGIHSALGPDDTVRIMLHYSQGGSRTGTQWFVDRMRQYGVPFDLLGLSYYPWWHGSLSDLGANLRATAQQDTLDILVVETAYPWRSGGWEALGGDSLYLAWPATPQGQQAFLHDLRATVRAVPGGRGAGLLWWYPEAVPVTGLFTFAGGSLALFDSSGNLLPAAAELSR